MRGSAGALPARAFPALRSSSGPDRRSSALTRLDDPALVAGEYADDARLRRRAAAFTGAPTTRDARVPLVAAVSAAKPERVLEVGCGWGELAEWIRRDTGAAVVATDLSPHMVDLARERGVNARLADVQDLPFGDGEFDVAVAAWMLYHVPDLDRGVAELARVLRPGGRLVAVTNSRFHLLELRELVGSGPSTLKFSREDGEAILSRRFERIAREDIDGRLEFANRRDVEEYVRASISMSPFLHNLPAVVPEPLFARRANSIFVAERD
jgi:SAM-dependent methyltransferase